MAREGKQTSAINGEFHEDSCPWLLQDFCGKTTTKMHLQPLSYDGAWEEPKMLLKPPDKFTWGLRPTEESAEWV